MIHNDSIDFGCNKFSFSIFKNPIDQGFLPVSKRTDD